MKSWRLCIAAGLLAAAAGAPAGDAQVPAGAEVATFAGGCFWCMEGPFDALDGVLTTTSGYTGGNVPAPDYEAVSAGGTGHVEAVQVVFEPGRTSFRELLEVFWVNVDPTDGGGQFCDRGPQYRPVLFYHNDLQRRAAEESLAKLERDRPFREPIRVELRQAGPFYPAETYHQDYYLKNPLRYRFYRFSCGRDTRLEELWGPRAGK